MNHLVLVNLENAVLCALHGGSVGGVGTTILYSPIDGRVRVMIPLPANIATDGGEEGRLYEVAERRGGSIVFPWREMNPLSGPTALVALIKLARGGEWTLESGVWKRVR